MQETFSYQISLGLRSSKPKHHGLRSMTLDPFVSVILPVGLHGCKPFDFGDSSTKDGQALRLKLQNAQEMEEELRRMNEQLLR